MICVQAAFSAIRACPGLHSSIVAFCGAAACTPAYKVGVALASLLYAQFQHQALRASTLLHNSLVAQHGSSGGSHALTDQAMVKQT